jgi:tetratricopeptide (TPR) repeat protein
MKVVALALMLLVGASRVHADSSAAGRPDYWKHIRALFDAGDYAGAKRELLELQALEPSPAVLFALGQAELNLGNYQAAIDYYEQFIATNPSADQVGLAQQGIGAARLKLSEPVEKPPPEPPPPPREEPPRPAKRWTLTHTGVVALGGAAVLGGGGVLLYSRARGHDPSGTLSQSDARGAQARTTRWTGLGIAAVGTIAIGVTLVW